MSEKKVYSLSSLTHSIEKVVNEHCNRQIWIRAEIVKLNYYTKTGHCYPALVEKKNGKLIAELRGNIWSSNFQKINNKFKSVLKEELRDDMTVVIFGIVTFHPVHGLALNILDIDPHYTLGELAREKAATIERLQKENIFAANKSRMLPLLPKTIAIISVDSSKGYQDFLEVIERNTAGFKFHHLLFPAILQGERAVKTILEQLQKIEEHKDIFDAVAIIRGGGGEIGLSSFDSYELAHRISTFPLPVLTGIGHAANETVTELVSHKSFITPTKIAEFLLQNFQDFYLTVSKSEDRLRKEVNWMYSQQKTRLSETTRLFNSLTKRTLESNKSALEQLQRSLLSETRNLLRKKQNTLKDATRGIHTATGVIKLHQQYLFHTAGHLKDLQQGLLLKEQNGLHFLEQSLQNTQKTTIVNARQKLGFTEEKLRMLSPQNILKRGFSITRHNGSVIKNPEQLAENEVIQTQLYSGELTSRIEKTDKTT